MLKIVLEIILDSFNELREKQNVGKRQEIFIINIEKNECVKKNKDYNVHYIKEYNLCDYAIYMIILRMTEFENLNRVN